MIFLIAAIVYSLMFAGVFLWMEYFPWTMVQLFSWANWGGWIYPKDDYDRVVVGVDPADTGATVTMGLKDDQIHVLDVEVVPDYRGYPFARYDTNGAPLYKFGDPPMAADAKFIDYCYGGPPPGEGSYHGMKVDEWTWSAKSKEWHRG